MQAKIALIISYQGQNYYGWQLQRGLRTVQQVVEGALSSIAQENISVVAAGRTDRGVHAVAQVVHFETSVRRRVQQWAIGANHFLPDDIRVKSAQVVRPEFHARHTARKRHYKYLIYNHSEPCAHSVNKALWVRSPLDIFEMQKAARLWEGEHDFTSFRAAACQARSPVRDMKKIQIISQGDYLSIELSANAFLYHMVRNMVGVLLSIGLGRRPAEWAGEVLHARDRSKGGVMVGPSGLYLERIEYPENYLIA